MFLEQTFITKRFDFVNVVAIFVIAPSPAIIYVDHYFLMSACSICHMSYLWRLPLCTLFTYSLTKLFIMKYCLSFWTTDPNAYKNLKALRWHNYTFMCIHNLLRVLCKCFISSKHKIWPTKTWFFLLIVDFYISANEFFFNHRCLS